MPVDAAVWRENPPQSSCPANVAYTTAEFQDAGLARRYLRRVRAAVSVERRAISRRPVLIELADEVGLDVDSFPADLASDRAGAGFRRWSSHAATVTVLWGDRTEVRLTGKHPLLPTTPLAPERVIDLGDLLHVPSDSRTFFPNPCFSP